MRFQVRLMVIVLAMPTEFVGVDRAGAQSRVNGMLRLCDGHG